MREVVSSAFYIILISPTECCASPQAGGEAILRPRAILCPNGVGHLFPARTNKGIDYVGHRGPSRGTEWPSIYTRGTLARTASENSGVDALNVCRLPGA